MTKYYTVVVHKVFVPCFAKSVACLRGPYVTDIRTKVACHACIEAFMRKVYGSTAIGISMTQLCLHTLAAQSPREYDLDRSMLIGRGGRGQVMAYSLSIMGTLPSIFPIFALFCYQP